MNSNVSVLCNVPVFCYVPVPQGQFADAVFDDFLDPVVEFAFLLAGDPCRRDRLMDDDTDSGRPDDAGLLVHFVRSVHGDWDNRDAWFGRQLEGPLHERSRDRSLGTGTLRVDDQ